MNGMILTPRGLLYQGQRIACTIGRSGLTSNKVEGDGATPRGLMHVVEVLYRPDRITCPNTWATPIGLNDLWCDAADHGDYNQKVQRPFDHSHETLRRADPLYDLIFVLDWNYPKAQSGKGSAIFMHRWRKPGHPTEGCVAMHPLNLMWLAQRITPGTPLLIQ